MTPEERYQHRLEHATPIINNLREWLDQVLPQVPLKSATGKALYYLNRQWDKLTRYLQDGHLEFDYNRCEHAIRAFVIGRKAWLFSDSVAGVNACTNLYSLLETAESHGLEPYAYLREVFVKLPAATTVVAIEASLPSNIDAKHLTPR